MIKLQTPLVIGTILIVTLLGIIRLVLVPDSWISSLAALAFLPVAIGILLIRPRSHSESGSIRKVSGKLRAGLVGAGVLLATSLLMSITDQIGLTGQSGEGSGGKLIAILSAIVAVAIDFLSGKLERKAEEDPD